MPWTDTSAVEQRVLGPGDDVRAFRYGRRTAASGADTPLAKFAAWPQCDERPGAVSYGDGDHRTHEPLVTDWRSPTIDRCVKGEYPARIGDFRSIAPRLTSNRRCKQ